MSLNALIMATLEIWGSIFCFICLAIVFTSRKLSKRTWHIIAKIMLSLSLILLFDAIAYIYAEDASPESVDTSMFSISVVFLMTVSFAYYYKEYIRVVVKANGGDFEKSVNWAINICTLLEVVMVVSNLWKHWIFYCDEQNTYVVQFGYILLVAAFLIGLAFLIWEVVINGKYLTFETKFLFGFTFATMLISSVVQTMMTDISITNIALMVIVFVSFAEYEAGIADRVFKRDLEIEKKKTEIEEQRAEAALAEAKAAQASAEAAEYRARMITSQIQPHFLFNSLNAIKALAMIDPSECINAVDYLSKFLRGSLDAINSNEPITITKEFENTNAYLQMQKYRFGSSLTVEMEDTSEGFLVPPFTIQPLVENAVHAIRAKEDGKGSIKVTAYSIKDECHKILVADTGTGFDPAKVGEDGRGHYGMAIVRERIEKMSGGTMEIHSVIGEGTTMEITIPWKRAEN